MRGAASARFARGAQRRGGTAAAAESKAAAQQQGRPPLSLPLRAPYGSFSPLATRYPRWESVNSPLKGEAGVGGLLCRSAGVRYCGTRAAGARAPPLAGTRAAVSARTESGGPRHRGARPRGRRKSLVASQAQAHLPPRSQGQRQRLTLAHTHIQHTTAPFDTDRLVARANIEHLPILKEREDPAR